MTRRERVFRYFQSLKHGGELASLAKILAVDSSEIIDFSQNINPFAPQAEIVSAIAAALGEIKNYPDGRLTQLRSLIAQKHGVEQASVILGNGASELIFRLAFALQSVVTETAAYLPEPNFSEYERAFKNANWSLIKGLALGADLLAEWPAETSVSLLCHPNNPTGKLLEPDVLEDLLLEARSRQGLLVLDQCFIDFLPAALRARYDALGIAYRVGAQENLLSIHSLTKFFGIAGLRLGYLLVPERQLARRLEELAPAWPLNTLAEAAGLAALQMPEESLEAEREAIASLREELVAGLKGLNDNYGRELFKNISGTVNFIYFESEIEELAAELALHQPVILIRSLRNYRGLPSQAYRVAVKRAEEISILLSALDELATTCLH
ncbi:MAG: aminotransferase class I/II-fold pyridoxal phosphate-dependent enzyme [Eubacteriales bacterium]|nr:aminotransferase class I/II-fold pyridoxal phosphate-dependent enzyme [Eubacteriales bacterium]